MFLNAIEQDKTILPLGIIRENNCLIRCKEALVILFSSGL